MFIVSQCGRRSPIEVPSLRSHDFLFVYNRNRPETRSKYVIRQMSLVLHFHT